MKAAERERRNAQVLALWLSGATHRAIAAAVGLRSHRSVGNIVVAALGDSGARRELLTGEAFAVWQERTERLFRAHWQLALDGNHRSAELCRKLLANMALVYGLHQEIRGVATQLDAVEAETVPEGGDTDEDGLDLLARMRMDHARALGGVGKSSRLYGPQVGQGTAPPGGRSHVQAQSAGTR